MRKSCAYPTSTRDEARFPCIGSTAILRSPSNMTSGLTSFRQLQRFSGNTVPSLEEHHVQHSKSWIALCTPNRLEMSVIPLLRLKSYANFPHATQEEASPSNMMWEGSCVCYPKWNGDLDALSRKKAGFPCSGLNAGSNFISQVKGCLNPLWRP